MSQNRKEFAHIRQSDDPSPAVGRPVNTGGIIAGMYTDPIPSVPGPVDWCTEATTDGFSNYFVTNGRSFTATQTCYVQVLASGLVVNGGAFPDMTALTLTFNGTPRTGDVRMYNESSLSPGILEGELRHWPYHISWGGIVATGIPLVVECQSTTDVISDGHFEVVILPMTGTVGRCG